MSDDRPKVVKKQKQEEQIQGFKLQDLVRQADKQYGHNLIKQGSAIPNITCIPTGIFMLDMALLGGFPENRCALVYGNASSGKSMLSLKTAASAQRKYPNSNVLYINTESELDRGWAEINGVDLSRLYEAHPRSGEHVADILLAAMEAEDVNFIILDSLANIVPMKEYEASFEDNQMGMAAKLQARMFRNVANKMKEQSDKGHKITLFFINQFRSKIGLVFGDPRVLPGGMAQHFASDVSIEMANKEVMSKDADMGVDKNQHSFKITKNKTGSSIRSGEFIINRSVNSALAVGAPDDVETVFAYATKFGLGGGAGAGWHLLDDKFKSRAAIYEMLYNEPDRLEVLKKQLIGLQRKSMGIPALPPDKYI